MLKGEGGGGSLLIRGQEATQVEAMEEEEGGLGGGVEECEV